MFSAGPAPPSAEPVLQTAALLLEPLSAGSRNAEWKQVATATYAGAHALPVSDVETLVDFSMKSAIADLR